MDEVINAAKELKEAIDNLPLTKEYYLLSNLLENDESLKEMRKEIARLAFEGKEQERENLLKVYNNNPLVSNYQAIKSELTDLLKEIVNQIQ